MNANVLFVELMINEHKYITFNKLRDVEAFRKLTVETEQGKFSVGSRSGLMNVIERVPAGLGFTSDGRRNKEYDAARSDLTGQTLLRGRQTAALLLLLLFSPGLSQPRYHAHLHYVLINSINAQLNRPCGDARLNSGPLETRLRISLQEMSH